MKKNNRTSHTAQATKSIVTTKDTTKAIETRAGVLKDAPEAPKAELKTQIFLQYLGTECSTDDILAKVKDGSLLCDQRRNNRKNCSVNSL